MNVEAGYSQQKELCATVVEAPVQALPRGMSIHLVVPVR